MIGSSCHSYSNTSIEFPLGPKVEIDRGNDLLLLISQGIETGDGSPGCVILDAAINSLGEVVSNFRVGRKLDSLIHAGSVKRPIERGIESQIPAAAFLIDYRANCPGPCIGRKGVALIADFVRQAHAHRPFPFFGDAKARTN